MLRQPTFKWWKGNFVWSARAQLLSLNTHLSHWVFLVVANKFPYQSWTIWTHWIWPCCLLQLSGWHFLRPEPCLTQPQRPHVTVTHLPPPHSTMPPWKPLWQTTNISRSHCTLRHLPLPSPIYLQQRPTTLTDTFAVCLAPTILRSSSTQRKEAYHFCKRRWHKTAHITQH